MKKLKEFLNSELGLFLIMFFTTLTTLTIIQIIFFISNKSTITKPYKSYSVIIEDPICNCDILYKTDTIIIDSMINFRSDGINYQLDTNIVKQIIP